MAGVSSGSGKAEGVADNEKEAVLVDNTYGDDSIVLAVKNPLLFAVAQRLCHDAAGADALLCCTATGTHKHG